MAGKKGFVMVPAIRNPGGKIRRRPNVAAGFVDEEGRFSSNPRFL
jgi:hypothetical protein